MSTPGPPADPHREPDRATPSEPVNDAAAELDALVASLTELEQQEQAAAPDAPASAPGTGPERAGGPGGADAARDEPTSVAGLGALEAALEELEAGAQAGSPQGTPPAPELPADGPAPDPGAMPDATTAPIPIRPDAGGSVPPPPPSAAPSAPAVGTDGRPVLDPTSFTARGPGGGRRRRKR